MKRRKPKDYVVGEPAVFFSIEAGPEFAAECEELERFKLTENEPFNYDVLRRRKYRRELDDREKARYGDAYEEWLRIRAAFKSDVWAWIKPMAEDASARGFRYFRCNQDTNRFQLQLQFADGKGSYFQRSVSLNRFADKYALSLNWDECLRIRSAVESYIRELVGMGMLDHGMTARRVPANMPPS